MVTRDRLGKHPPKAISLTAAVLIGVALGSCDVDVFGITWKQIGAGYQLVESEIPHACGVIAPGGKFGPLAGEIGWRKPFIIFRESGSKPWTVIDTRTRHETSIFEAQRASDPNYSNIPIYRADDAWHRLSRFKRQCWVSRSMAAALFTDH
jgi:hypothetical protein